MSGARTAEPLHRRIYADIEGRILSNRLSPGERIPFEHELSAQYGCSRMTVSKAISELAQRGLVTRRRRAGTFVSAPRTHSAVLAIPDIGAEVAARGQAYGYRLLARSERPAADGGEAALAGAGGLLELVCLHSADDEPLALERRWIALSAVPEAAGMDFAAVSPGRWLLDSAPWTEAEHRISAVAADARSAKLLRLPTGSACLCVERRTWREGQGITRVWQTFPGDRYDLVARFSPARGDTR